MDVEAFASVVWVLFDVNFEQQVTTSSVEGLVTFVLDSENHIAVNRLGHFYDESLFFLLQTFSAAAWALNTG